MSRFFTIRLIQNDIDLTAQLVRLIGQQFSSYTLSVARELCQAISEPEPVDVILLNAAALADPVAGDLAALAQAYDYPPILLLVPPDAAENIVLEALEHGADDYIPLSAAGKLVLTRRLAALYQAWLEEQISSLPASLAEPSPTESEVDPATVTISADYCLKAWNSAAERLLGITEAAGPERSLHDLSLSAERLSRFKDLVDQTRSSGRAVFVSLVSSDGVDLEEQLEVYAYPLAATGEVRLVITPGSKSELSTERQTMRLSLALQQLADMLYQMSDQASLGEMLKRLLEQALSLLGVAGGQIFFLDKDNQKFSLSQAVGYLAPPLPGASIAVGRPPLDNLTAQSRSQMLRGQQFNPALPYDPQDYLLVAPLTAVRGVIGLLLVSRAGRPFSLVEHYLLDSLAQQASLVINYARLYEESERSLAELSILDQASRTISGHWDHQAVLENLIGQLVQVIGVSRGFIASWDRQQNRSHIQAQFVAGPGIDRLEPGLDLMQRATLITLIDQKRPVFLYRDNPALDEIERQIMEAYDGYARLLVPLVARGESIGWVELWDSRPERTFDSHQVRLARALSSQMAIALQNLMYLQQSQRTLEETTALYRVASILTTRQDQQAIIDVVLREFLQALHLTQGAVVIFDFNAKCGIVKARLQDEQPVRPPSTAGSGLALESGVEPITEGHRIPLPNNPVYEQLRRTDRPVHIDNPKADWLTKTPSFAALPELPPAGGWGDLESFRILVIPVRMREAIVGALVAENTRHNRAFDDWDVSTGQAMADQLGVGLQNVQLYESEYRRREQAETLREVAAVVSSSLNLKEVLERILVELGRVIQYDSAAIHLIERGYRRVIAGRGFQNVAEHIGLIYPVHPDEDHEEPGAIAIQSRKPLVFGDVSRMLKAFGTAKHSHIKSWMGIPLIARDKVIGLISIDHAQYDAYTYEDAELATAFANQVAVTLENARLHEIEIRDIERELTIAHEIQETLLPQFIPQIPGLDIAGRIVPARQVGGDFFHFFSTKPEELGVAIGDVSGKGIPAALYMAAGITAIETQTGPGVSPGELLNKLNTKLFNRLRENKMNIALQIATFEPLPQEQSEAGEPHAQGSLMTAANAGMIAPIGATVHGCRYLPVGGLPIGALPAAQYTYQDDMFLLDPFTTIILTSDGIVEAQNDEGELFGFERLEQTILEIIESRDAQVITDYIIDAAQHFTGEAEQHDDMTVVVVVKR